MTGDDLAVFPDVNEVVGMEAVALVDVHAVLAVAEGEERARHQAARGIGGDDGVHAVGRARWIAVLVHIADEIHAEIVEAEIGDGDPDFQVLHLDHLVLKAAELFFAVGDFVGFRIERVVTAGGAGVGDDHAVFDSLLEVDVFIERDVRPVVDELDDGVSRADAVDAPEALDDPNRVPVNVVIDQVVAVLEVLAF